MAIGSILALLLFTVTAMLPFAMVAMVAMVINLHIRVCRLERDRAREFS